MAKNSTPVPHVRERSELTWGSHVAERGAQTGGSRPLLVLGIGNVLMGDEGVGVHVVRRLQEMPLPPRVECLDGGCGSFYLLDAMQQARKIILIDATIDANGPGTVQRLQPRFSADYPRTLTAHDIGLKDLLDAFHLLGKTPDVVLFAISIAPLQELGMELSTGLQSRMGEFVGRILAEIAADHGCSAAEKVTTTA